MAARLAAGLLTAVFTAGATASLYTGPLPRPGPDILYAAPATAPQLENTGIWRALPILISGASAYRNGEFLYQDYLYDDHGALGLPDPSDPRAGDPGDPEPANLLSKPAGTYSYPTLSAYANNAADLVEFRVRPVADGTAFRITMNTLLDAERTGFTLVIGSASSASASLPFGSNMRAAADWFVTVHGRTAVMHNAQTGAVTTTAPTVTVDTLRRQFELRVPRSIWNPGRSVARFALGVGLWEGAKNRYLLPQASATDKRPGGSGNLKKPAAFFNAAFRYNEALPDITTDTADGVLTAWWRDRQQATTLAGGTFGDFYASVDFARLRDGVTDELANQPGGTPTQGVLNRIHASHFETAQGANYSLACGSNDGCLGALRGQLLPYAIHVPNLPLPAGGYGLSLLLHSLAANYNQYSGSRNQSQLSQRGRGHLVVTPSGRGPDGWSVEHAGAELYEVWADVSRNYPLSSAHTVITGYSMGGYGAFREATRYPDLYAAVQTTVAPPAIGTWRPPMAPSGGEASNSFNQLAGLRHVPIQMWAMAEDERVPDSGTQAQADELLRLGLRYEYRDHLRGDHMSLALNDSYADAASFLGDAAVDTNPARIDYVVNPTMDFAGVSLVADHAYWLSGLRLRDGSGLTPRGSVAAFSHAFAAADPVPSGILNDSGTLTGGSLGPIAYSRQRQTWSNGSPSPVADRLSLTLRNLSAIVVNPQRARLTCNALLSVNSDGPVTVTLSGCNRSQTFGG